MLRSSSLPSTLASSSSPRRRRAPAFASRDGEGPEDVNKTPPAPPAPAPARRDPGAERASRRCRVEQRQRASRPTRCSRRRSIRTRPRPERVPGTSASTATCAPGTTTRSKDERYDFVGRNNGFVLDSARVGVQGRNRTYDVTFRISIEGASDVLTAPNTPLGSLSVRLRDGFARWDPVSFARHSGGPVQGSLPGGRAPRNAVAPLRFARRRRRGRPARPRLPAAGHPARSPARRHALADPADRRRRRRSPTT